MKILLVLVLSLFLLGCRDIFTTNHFGAFIDKSPTAEYATSLLSSRNVSDAELQRVILALEKNRITLEDVQNDPSLKKAFLEETKLIADLKIKKADVNSLISAASSGNGGEEALKSLLQDEERIDDIKGASDLIVEMYKVDPSSLSETDKLIGAAGLIEDIISDDALNEKLSNVEDYETDTLEAQGFSSEQIEKIQLANEMVEGSDLAKDFLF